MKTGIYDGKIKDACVGRSRNGSLQVELLLETEDEQSISWFGNLSGGAMEYTVATLKFYGLQDGQGPEVVIGKNCRFEVYQDNYNGKITNKVKMYTRVGLMTKKEDRISGAQAAAILSGKPAFSPPPRQQRERMPGDDMDDMTF